MRLLEPVKHEDLTGGCNFGVPAYAIGRNELAYSLNFKPTKPWIRTRGGSRQMGAAAAAFQILGFQPSVKGGEWIGVIWGSHAVGYFTGAAAPLTFNFVYTVSPQITDEPWVTTSWQRTLFGARPSNGLIMARFETADVVSTAGIAPPTFVAAAADGAAGTNIPAGNYSYVFTYYDSASGTESSYGPQSNILAHGAGTQINLTGLVASTNPRVDSIRIYRTFTDGTSAWYRVATIPHTDVSYIDDIPTFRLGPAAEANNGLPPAGVFSVANWNGRLWVTDGRFVYPSKLQNPEAFDPADALAVGTANDRIVGLLATPNALVVGRRHGMSYITGTGKTTWRIEEADSVHGLVSSHALVRVGDEVWWLTDTGLCRGNGTSRGAVVTGNRLRSWFGTLFGFASFPTAEQFSQFVLASIPTSDGLLFSTHLSGGLFFYHIPTDSIWPWRIQNVAGQTGAIFYVSSGVGPDGKDWAWTTLAGADNAYLLRIDDESYYQDDVGGIPNSIAQRLVPPFIDLGDRRGLIHELRIQWMTSDPRVQVIAPVPTPYFDTGLSALVQLKPWRHWTASSGSGQIQPVRIVPITPKRGQGLDRDESDQWKAYRLQTKGQTSPPIVPSNTLGLELDFTSQTGSAAQRPLWIGRIQWIPAMTDLREKAS